MVNFLISFITSMIMTERLSFLGQFLILDSLLQHHTLTQLCGFLAEQLLPRSTTWGNSISVNTQVLPPLCNLLITNEEINLSLPQVNTKPVPIFQDGKVSSGRRL